MTLVLFNARVVHYPNVVVHVEVEKRARLSSGLGHDEVVERKMLRVREQQQPKKTKTQKRQDKHNTPIQ